MWVVTDRDGAADDEAGFKLPTTRVSLTHKRVSLTHV